MPFISIITICFNEAKKIEDTCRSVVSQSFTDYEWIIIDGGSKDNTLDVLKKYESHITYISSEPDKGIYNAMNKGIKQAKGTYCLFLNGGDYFYEPDVLEKYVAPFRDADHHPDILYGEVLNEQTNDYIRHLKDLEINLDFFSQFRSLHHQATFIKTSKFKELGVYDESYRMAGDYDWFVRYFVMTPEPDISYIDGVVSYFNTHGVSFNPALRGKIIREVLRSLLSNLRKHPVLATRAMYKFFRAHYTVRYTFRAYYIAYKHILLAYTVRVTTFLGIKKPARYIYRKFFKKEEATNETQ